MDSQGEAAGVPTSAALRLASLDTCAVSDALDRLGLAGAVRGIHSVWPCGRISGAVVTVRLRRPRSGERPRVHLGATAIDLAKPGEVIVIAHGGRDDAAGWGGLLSLAASLKGVAGVIVDGACRDVDDSRDLAFPVYARTAVPGLVSSKTRRASSWMWAEWPCARATLSWRTEAGSSSCRQIARTRCWGWQKRWLKRRAG